MAEYEKIKRMTIPLGIDHVMLITTEVPANLEIINNILKRLENWRDENVLSAVV